MTSETKKDTSTIELSVVVISVFSQASLENCLNSIVAPQYPGKIEIIVADACADEQISHLINKFPDISFLQFPAKTGIPRLSASAITRSSGKIVALTDSTCVPAENWISSILNAHQKPSPVIGGAVDIRGQRNLLNWAAYFCEYGEFMLPLTGGEVSVMPGNNISFKRGALEIGDQFEKDEFWKTYWCRELQANGVALISEPSMVVYYDKEFRLSPFLSRRFNHGRCFAAMRTQATSFIGRMFFTLGSLFLPIVFFYRISATVLSKKRLLREFLLSVPFIVTAILFWSLGESCGYLAGAGKSCDYIN